jgi:hypothetical protein
MLFSFKSEKHTNCFDRYDRDFVLQFRDYCMERPLRMEEHEVITPAQPIEQSVPTATRTRRRRSVRSNAEPVVPTPILTGSTLVVPVTASLPSASLTAARPLARYHRVWDAQDPEAEGPGMDLTQPKWAD